MPCADRRGLPKIRSYAGVVETTVRHGGKKANGGGILGKELPERPKCSGVSNDL